jgi:pimeloyl-ACP methyl ester carboxylesterase
MGPGRFFNPDNANLLLSEPGSRNIELYPLFSGADVDFIIGGQLPAIPDFRPRLKGLKPPLQVLAGRYDRALYPQLQQQFLEIAPQAHLEIMERSGSFAHIEEPATVFEPCENSGAPPPKLAHNQHRPSRAPGSLA